MKIIDVQSLIEQIAPLRLAQPWDNVGLLVGDLGQAVHKILLTIDVTKDTVTEASKLKTNLIISYHPVIWDPLKKITTEPPNEIIYELMQSKIAVFSVHTALDTATGGINDVLAEIVGIKDSKPIGDFVNVPQAENFKLVVFIPPKSAAAVANAIFAAGAGWIGNYRHCGFTGKGEGSFLPLSGANPTIGKKGRIEKVEEVRFETVVPSDKLEDVITALKQTHPYETPAFDCFKLYNPQEKFGLGRIGTLDSPTPIKKIIQRIKRYTGAKVAGIVGNQKQLVRKAAVCAGSCGKLINLVIAAKADLYVTGELKHHHALATQQANLTCICLSHSVSERFILKKFAKQLQKLAKDIKINISKTDKDPFTWKQL